MIRCPNKNDPKWKTLVEALGEDRAYQAYFRHPIDSGIPDIEVAKANIAKPSATGIRNAVIDEERKQRGLEPIGPAAKREWGTVWSEAGREIDKNPLAHDAITTKLANDPSHVLTDKEVAILTYRKNELANQYEKSALEFERLTREGTPEEIEAARNDVKSQEQVLAKFENTVRAAGTEQGRSLAARKMLVERDGTLASVIADATVAKGSALTDAERAKFTGLFKDMEEAKQARASLDERRAVEAADRAHAAMLNETVKKSSHFQSESVKKSLSNLSDKWKKWASEAAGTTGSGPAALLSESAFELYSAAFDAALELSKAGIKTARDFSVVTGIPFNRLLEQAWEDARKGKKRSNREEVQAPTKEDAAKPVEPATPEEKRQATVDKIKSKKQDGATPYELRSMIQKLARHEIELGVRERQKVVDNVHNTLIELGIDITPQKTRDAISGYGDFKELSKDETSRELRRVKGELQQVAKIEDMQGGQAPKKTGIQRREIGDEERRLIKEVNELKKKGGYVVEDPEKALKTALDTTKTRLRNQISDLEDQIETGVKHSREKTLGPTDTEIENLKKRRDELKAKFDEVFGDQEAEANKALQESIDEYQRKLAAGEFEPAEKTPQKGSAELIAKRDAAKKAFEDAKKSDPKNQQRAIEEAENAAQELNDELARKINEGEVESKKSGTGKTSSKLEALRAENKQLQNIIGKLRREPTKLSPDEIAIKRAISSVERSITDYERRIKTRDFNTSTKPGPTNARLDALRSKRDALSAELEALKAADKGYQDAKANKALQASIAEYERKVKGGEFDTPTATPERGDKALIEKRDAARKAFQDAKASDPATKARKIQEAIDRAQAVNDDLTRRINEGELDAKKSKASDTSPELEALREENRQMQGILAKLRREKTRLTPEEVALKRYKAIRVARIAELEDRIATGRFEPKDKPLPVELDKEAQDLDIKRSRAELEFNKAKEAFRIANRTNAEKAHDIWHRWRRELLLSSPATFGKLTMAAAWRMAFNPLENAIGAGLSKVPGLSKVFDESRTQNFSLKAEAKAFTAAFTKGMKDAADVARTGVSDLDAQYGLKTPVPEEMRSFLGQLHGAIKAPVKRAAFERAMQIQAEYYLDKGVDITDPMTQLSMGVEAYKTAEKDIFMQDNRLVSAYKAGLATLRAKTKPGEGIAGKAVAEAVQDLLPIVRIPANIVGEAVGEYILGLPRGAFNALQSLSKELKPAEADAVARQLKKGVLGTSLLLLGYYLADKIGGSYIQGDKSKDHPNFGDVKIGNFTIPKRLLHNPAIDALMMGATIRHAADMTIKGEKQGLSSGAVAGMVGLAEDLPFVGEAMRVGDLKTPSGRQRWMDEQIKSHLVPAGSDALAKLFDKEPEPDRSMLMNMLFGDTVPRKPDGVIQTIESGIPGLRNTLPVNKKTEALMKQRARSGEGNEP